MTLLPEEFISENKKKYLSKHQFYPQYLLFGHHMEKLLRDNLNDTTQ